MSDGYLLPFISFFFGKGAVVNKKKICSTSTVLFLSLPAFVSESYTKAPEFYLKQCVSSDETVKNVCLCIQL